MISNFLQNGQVGNIATSKQAEARKAIMERWENIGFTKGLDKYLKTNMSILFENEANMLLSESTDATNSGSFETVVFPLVRRVFSRLLANDIVSVQAMNMPIGKLFFILPVTSERKWEQAQEGTIDGATGSHYGLMGYERVERNNNGEIRNRYYLPDEVVNVDESGNTPEVVQFMKKSLYDLFYNDFLFDNSKGKVHIKVGSIEPVRIAANGDYKALEEIHVSGIDDSVRNVIVAVGGFSSFRASKLTGPDGNEMDSEAFLASLKVVAKQDITSSDSAETEFSCFKAYEPVHFRCVTQRYGKGLVEYGQICDAQGKIYLELDLIKPVKKRGATIDGYIGIDPSVLTVDNISDYFEAAWAQYDSLELETEIGEVSFKLSDVTVSVEERKLRATWSPELAQDVAAFHNIDAEAELTAILSEQIAAEIDREILRDLRKGAPWQLRWDYNGWRRQAGFSTNYTQKDWNQTFMTKMNQISAQIHKSTLRGGASFAVVSTEISAMLNDLEYFHVTDANAEATSYSMGIEKVGALQGRYQVYVDPYSPPESCIIGHKGDSLLDTGYIYAPYVPMQLTPTIYNTANFAPVKGIITRYAKKMVNNRYYGHIVCNGLQTWDINELR
ncbi:MAG: hypothetical protein J6Y37_10145 [Paludibacteraceae bacterium]|nr:hypothetical protein [Paludibacteraceae bacterium]